MLLLAIVGTLLGAVLAQRFKIMILIPAATPLMGVAITAGLVQGDPAWYILLKVASGCMSIQIGYFVGLGIRHLLEAAPAQGPAAFRPDPAAHHSVHTKASGKVA